jgi:putative redox protein
MELVVRHQDRDGYQVEVRGHTVQVDQPVDAGGDDRGPTPVELFVGSLAACVAHYAGRYLARHGLRAEDLRVEAAWAMADRPARVSSVSIGIQPPVGLPPERAAGLLAVARHCTVHNSLGGRPVVTVELIAPWLASSA